MCPPGEPLAPVYEWRYNGRMIYPILIVFGFFVARMARREGITVLAAFGVFFMLAGIFGIVALIFGVSIV